MVGVPSMNDPGIAEFVEVPDSCLKRKFYQNNSRASLLIHCYHILNLMPSVKYVPSWWFGDILENPLIHQFLSPTMFKITVAVHSRCIKICIEKLARGTWNLVLLLPNVHIPTITVFVEWQIHGYNSNWLPISTYFTDNFSGNSRVCVHKKDPIVLILYKQ